MLDLSKLSGVTKRSDIQGRQLACISAHLKIRIIQVIEISTYPNKTRPSLDFTGVERHSEVEYECENIAFGDIESH
jgi:hypothetical protein